VSCEERLRFHGVNTIRDVTSGIQWSLEIRKLDTGKLLLVGYDAMATGTIVLVVVVQDFGLADMSSEDRRRNLRSVTNVTAASSTSTTVGFLRIGSVSTNSLGTIQVTVNSWVYLVHYI